MKVLMTLAFGLISLVATGQDQITDSLLYELTKETIKDFIKPDIKLLKSVATPTDFWKTRNYFSTADYESILSQINNPIIKTWDVETLRKVKGIRLVGKLKGNNCLLISLPIFSKDHRTIGIFYEALDKYSGAGFVTIWKKSSSNVWIKEKEENVWITHSDRASPQQKLNAIAGAAFCQ